MLTLINSDNMEVNLKEPIANLIYADYVYENLEFNWINKYWHLLKSGGVFIVQTDHHSLFEVGIYLKEMPNAHFINHVVWKCEWGNHPKDRFHQSFDNILIFSKGKEHKFYSDRVQVPKATANTKLNPSGRTTKTATAFIDDICLTTTSNERVKQEDGHLIRWQKPEALLERLFLPFLDKDDLVIDPFMGSGTSARVCNKLGYNYIGIEKDPVVFKLAENSIQILTNN